MYKPDTILKLKDPRGVNEEGEAFPYDRVRVVGQSPVNHADITSEWVGANGQGVVLEPLTAFGANLDEPYGRVLELYDVESLPDVTVMRAEDQVKIVEPGDLGPSPEEVFSNDAAAEGQDSRRAKPRRFIPSPLVDTPPDPEQVAAEEKVKREALRRAGKLKDDEDGEASD